MRIVTYILVGIAGFIIGFAIVVALFADFSAYGETTDQWIEGLHLNGRHCCGTADCHPTDWRTQGDHFQVPRADGSWEDVPPAVVTYPDKPNPLGRALMCRHGETIYCFIPGVET